MGGKVVVGGKCSALILGDEVDDATGVLPHCIYIQHMYKVGEDIKQFVIVSQMQAVISYMFLEAWGPNDFCGQRGDAIVNF